MRLDNFVPKVNISLSLSIIVLAVYFALVQMQPYPPSALSRRNLKSEESRLMSKESSAMLKGTYAFDEKIFKKKNLFSQPVKKKTEEAKQAFILLGVSMGDKKLAMIRDVAQNRDYYCAQGDRIGAFRVKQIFKDKVVLESEGKTLEISQ